MKERSTTEIHLLTNRIEALERRFRLALIAPAILLSVLIFATWHTSAQRDVPQDVLTARQLVREKVIRRIAESKGWRAEIKPSDEAPNDWFVVELTKEGPSRDRPNPHGLRIVG